MLIHVREEVKVFICPTFETFQPFIITQSWNHKIPIIDSHKIMMSLLQIRHLLSVKNQILSTKKTKRKMSLLQRFWSVRWETQVYRNSEFWVAHRLKSFYEVYMEVIWLFQQIGCLLVFFLIWIRVATWGEQGSPDMARTDLAFGDWLAFPADV